MAAFHRMVTTGSPVKSERQAAMRRRNSGACRKWSWRAISSTAARSAGMPAAESASRQVRRLAVMGGCTGSSWLVAGELGDGFPGAGVVDKVLAGRRGGDERGDSGVVEGARQAVGDPVQPGDRVIGEKGVFAAGELEVVAQVSGGFGQVHRLDREPGRDP